MDSGPAPTGASRNDEEKTRRAKGIPSRSRGTMRPSFANHLPAEQQRAWHDPQERAWGMPGARCTRSPCAKGESTRSSPRSHRITRHSRTRLVLTAYAALSPATNSSCHRHRRMSGLARARLGSQHLRQFSTSNGCQDHTVLPSATRLRQEASAACAHPPKHW